MTHRPTTAIVATSCLFLTAAAVAQADPAARGAYLARIMDCAGCHMPRGADGAPIPEAGLSGGSVGFEIPGLGIFWPPNLTPSDTGLGNWTDAQIGDAIRHGQRPDGRMLAPAMPWPAYADLTDEDLDALVAFLRSVPPVDASRLDPAATAAAARAPFFQVAMPAN